jgi:hypothetical protein
MKKDVKRKMTECLPIEQRILRNNEGAEGQGVPQCTKIVGRRVYCDGEFMLLH